MIDDAPGKRVRNLVSETKYPAGDNVVYWDGLDDLGRDPDAAGHAIYYVPGRMVAPGTYKVRGLTRDTINLRYEMAPYTHGNPPWNNGDPASEWLANHTPPQSALFVPSVGKDKKPTVLIGVLRHRGRQRPGLAGPFGPQIPRRGLDRRRLDRRAVSGPRRRPECPAGPLCLRRRGLRQ